MDQINDTSILNTIDDREQQIDVLLRTNDIESIYDCVETHQPQFKDFDELINKLQAQLKYIKSGATGHTFRINVKNNYYALKVLAYPKRDWYGSPFDENRPENAEIKMIKLLSEFVLSKTTPHIILPISVFTTSVQNFTQYKGLIENKSFNKFIKMYEDNKLYDEACILISEWARCGDLLEFIRSNFKSMKLIFWQVMFFQLIFTLATIQKKYPSFRHNDLKANNILMQKHPYKKHSVVKYCLNGITYLVPNLGFSIQICDFDFSCIPNVVNNDKVSNKGFQKVNIIPDKNRYCDIHFFFITLIHFVTDFMDRVEIPGEVKEFIYKIIPPKYRIGSPKVDKKTYRILSKSEYLIPIYIIEKFIFFEKFRT